MSSFIIKNKIETNQKKNKNNKLNYIFIPLHFHNSERRGERKEIERERDRKEIEREREEKEKR